MPFKLHVLGLLVLVSCAPSLRASDLKAVEKEAMLAYFGADLFLSRPYLSNKLHFNAAGELADKSEEGTWTMNGIVHVENIETKSNLIRVTAKREAIILRTEGGKLGLQPILLTKHTQIDLEPSSPIVTLDDVKQTMARVFHREDLMKKFNGYWRSMGKVEGVDPKSGQLTIKGVTDGVYGYLNGDQPVYLPGFQVDPPKVVHKEGTEYTGAAAAKRTQGKTFMLVVVTADGYPAILHLIKDLGDDLDVQSLSATSQWRFRPATKDGKPVASVTRVSWEFTAY